MPVARPQVAARHNAARLALGGDTQLLPGLALSVDHVPEEGGSCPAACCEMIAITAGDVSATQLRALEDDAENSSAAAGRESGDAARSELAALQRRRKQLDTDIATLREIEHRATGVAELAKQAAALHDDIAGYEAIADALPPNGIPADLLAKRSRR